jgi:hypothetical protein
MSTLLHERVDVLADEEREKLMAELAAGGA